MVVGVYVHTFAHCVSRARASARMRADGPACGLHAHTRRVPPEATAQRRRPSPLTAGLLGPWTGSPQPSGAARSPLQHKGPGVASLPRDSSLAGGPLHDCPT